MKQLLTMTTTDDVVEIQVDWAGSGNINANSVALKQLNL